MEDKPKDKHEIYWNLRELLLERNIGRPQDFKEMLDKNGLVLSYTQCHGLMHEQPIRVTLKIILTICTMLKCSVSDLIVIRKAQERPPEQPAGFFS